MKPKSDRIPNAARAQYTFLGFRPTRLQESRLRSIAEKTGQKISDILRDCVAAQLPNIEAAVQDQANRTTQ